MLARPEAIQGQRRMSRDRCGNGHRSYRWVVQDCLHLSGHLDRAVAAHGPAGLVQRGGADPAQVGALVGFKVPYEVRAPVPRTYDSDPKGPAGGGHGMTSLVISSRYGPGLNTTSTQ